MLNNNWENDFSSGPIGLSDRGMYSILCSDYNRIHTRKQHDPGQTKVLTVLV